jgi:hypothetical protein
MLSAPLTGKMLIIRIRLAWVGFLLVTLFLNGCMTMNSAGHSEVDLAAYPPQLRFSTERSDLHFDRSPDVYALQYAQPESAPPEALQQMDDGTIAVFSAQHPPSRSAEMTASVTTPVYTLQPGNILAVPTGLVFVRFQPGTIATDHSASLQQAGYVIESSPPYAPHTAWVRSSSGNIADALSNLSNLEAIPAVENVEPQMVMEQSLRE